MIRKLSPETPIQYLPKVGPRYSFLFSKLEILTLQNLLWHFPTRYEDFTTVKRIADLTEGEDVTIRGTLIQVDNIFTKFGKKITKAVIQDDSGKIDLIWFNQHYLKKMLEPLATYEVMGKKSGFSSKAAFISPKFAKVTEQGSQVNLIPVYPETEGLSSKYISSRINDVLSGKLGHVELSEYLPAKLLEKYHFENLETSLKKIHMPSNLKETEISRNRFGFEELFFELLKIESRKKEWMKTENAPEMNLEKHQAKLEKFIKNLPFKLTETQDQASQEILKDLQAPHPMNRLLEGDVGTGKTVVAVIAAYAMHLCGLKTLYMAPTEILAQQHFATFQKLLAPYKIKIGLITGSTKKTDEIFDISIGTHALIYTDKKFEDLGLVIIDEQHRFGVEQRAKAIELGKNHADIKPNFLSMTATPIPRTLALTLFGDLSISKLANPPVTKKITTRVIKEADRPKIYEWMKHKLANSTESVFIVCPFIDQSDSESLENIKSAKVEFEYLRESVFKTIPMGLLHGKMKGAEKNQIIENFRRGIIKILVSTPVIEVGIDIPEATIMLIESAERYGLASLHQLRGRVGRSGLESNCFLFMSSGGSNSWDRLKNMEKTNNGLELAEIDLKMRGYGDIYGTKQHGFSTFKVADLTDLEFVEKAKLEAQFYGQRLSEYPLLGQHIKESQQKLVEKN